MADGDEQQRQDNKAGAEPPQGRRPEQRDGYACGQQHSEDGGFPVRECGEQALGFAEDDAVGAKGGEGQERGDSSECGDQQAELVDGEASCRYGDSSVGHRYRSILDVIPAKAGTQLAASAGWAMGPCFRRDDKRWSLPKRVMPKTLGVGSRPAHPQNALTVRRLTSGSRWSSASRWRRPWQLRHRPGYGR